MSAAEQIPVRKVVALTTAMLALAAPGSALAKPLNREAAQPLMRRTAVKLGTTVLSQFREAREAGDPNATITVTGPQHRAIKLIKTVPGEVGDTASYVLKASMRRGQDGRLDTTSTTSASIDAFYPRTASAGNPSSEEGEVFGFGIKRITGLVCKTESCRSILKIPAWLSEAAYKPEAGLSLSGPLVTSPDGSRIYNQMDSEPWPEDLGGDGKVTSLYPQEFRSEVDDALSVLEAAQHNKPIPESYNPPTNFNSFE